MTTAAEALSARSPQREPLVSVVIPTWNRARMLRLTLQTVLAQDLGGGDFEVLVIGDACTDDTEAVVASFDDPRLRWHNLPRNSGNQSVPNNTGLRMARGRYVAHLGHDDFWLPWHLSGLVTTIEKTRVDWVYPLVVAIGPTGVRHCTGPQQDGVPDAEHHVPPSGWLYRRDIVPDVGWWADPAAISWPIDFDYMRRAALAGKRFAFHARPTALKFPSNLFPDGYRTGEPSPIQREYFDRLRDDPGALEQEILRDLATRFAQLDRGGGKAVFARQQRGAASKQPLWWSARRWLIRRYGADRWPVPQLLNRGFQAKRRGRLQRRGLVPVPGHDDGFAGTARGGFPTAHDDGRATIPGEFQKRSASAVPIRLAHRAARRERRRQRELRVREREKRIRVKTRSEKVAIAARLDPQDAKASGRLRPDPVVAAEHAAKDQER